MNYFRQNFILISILLIGAFFRFYNLMHDAPYFFNPDERNMANAITQLRLPNKLSQIPICLVSQFSPHQLDARRYTLDANRCNLNPHFFAYGQFPLYLAYISDQIIQSFWQVPLNGTRPESHWDPGFIPKSIHPEGQAFRLNASQAEARMTTFPSAIFWLRFWSAFSSTLTVLLVYLITNILVNRHSGKRETSASRIPMRSWTSQDDNFGLNIGHYAAILAAFTPGLIQSAHFGTTESLLTFFFMASIYLSMKLINIPLSFRSIPNREIAVASFDKLRIPRNDIILLSLVIGLAMGSKLTGIFFFVPPVISSIVRTIELFKLRKKKFVRSLFEDLSANLRIGLLVFIGSICIFILTSPYNLIKIDDFKSAVFGYESDVATGKYEAFYTRQFVGTTPIIFQLEKIFPYALGWPVFILGSLGFLLILFKLVLSIIKSILHRIMNYESRIKNRKNNIPNSYFLILTFFLIYFIPNAFLFAKWTRFMTPIFPFFAIFSGYLLFSFRRLHLRGGATSLGYLFYILIITSILPGLMFMSIYTHEDSRVTASKWIYQNIPDKSYILSETANDVDIPLGIPNYPASSAGKQLPTANYTVISFDFYHLDENPLLFTNLINHLEKSDYIFIPSRRIFANYMRLPARYPLITKYYQLLFSGRLGYEKVAEINSFPQFSILNSQFSTPDEIAEETYTVFDHPVIRIYKKVKLFTKEQYRMLFEN